MFFILFFLSLFTTVLLCVYVFFLLLLIDLFGFDILLLGQELERLKRQELQNDKLDLLLLM
jgi:hypothetical protein